MDLAVSDVDVVLDATSLEVDAAAHRGAFGHNRIPEPTEAMVKAGNYKKGRIQIGPFRCVIENPRHTYRVGTDSKGKQWRSLMPAHYGYIAGTLGNDGDAVDCFIGQFPNEPRAYVINQAIAGRFDEHKVMLGFPSEDAARAAYLHSYSPGWTGLDSLVPVDFTQLRYWLNHGDKSRPISLQRLPAPGADMIKRTLWDSAAEPIGTTLAQLIYTLRLDDVDEGRLLEPMSPEDLESAFGAEPSPVFDGIVVIASQLDRKMAAMQRVMAAAMPEDVRPFSRWIGKPTLRRITGPTSTVNVDVVFTLHDGQTVTVCFHNPDSTPQRLAPQDELISWKWLLNKRDITIVVAPERGVDLNIREVARRIGRIAEKNSAAFAKANNAKAEKLTALAALKAEEADIDRQLDRLSKDIEYAKFDLEDARARQVPVPVVTLDEPAAVDPTDPADLAATIDQSVVPVPTTVTEAATASVEPAVTAVFSRIPELNDALVALGWEVVNDLPVKGDISVQYGEDEFAPGALIARLVKAGAPTSAATFVLKPDQAATETAAAIDAVVKHGDVGWYVDLTPSGEVKPAIEEIPSVVEATAEPKPVPRLAVASDTLGQFDDSTPEGKGGLRAAAKLRLLDMVGSFVDCPALGGSVEIRSSSVRKFISLSGDSRKLRLAGSIGEIIARGEKVGSKPTYDPALERNVAAYHSLRTEVQLDDVPLAVRVVVKEDDKGNFQWDATVHTIDAIFDSTAPNEKTDHRSTDGPSSTTSNGRSGLESTGLTRFACAQREEDAAPVQAQGQEAAGLSVVMLDSASPNEETGQQSTADPSGTTSCGGGGKTGPSHLAPTEPDENAAPGVQEGQAAAVLDDAGTGVKVFNLFIEGEDVDSMELEPLIDAPVEAAVIDPSVPAVVEETEVPAAEAAVIVTDDPPPAEVVAVAVPVIDEPVITIDPASNPEAVADVATALTPSDSAAGPGAPESTSDVVVASESADAAAAIDQRAVDLAYLGSVAKAEIDLDGDDIAAAIEAIYDRYPDDAEVLAAVEAAANAYQDFVTEAAQLSMADAA